MTIVQRKNLWIAAVALLALAAVGPSWSSGVCPARAPPMPKAPPPLIPVTAAPVVTRTMPVKLYAIGNVEAYTTVAVKARIDGQINSVHFNEGDEVKKGALLFEIDPRPLQASLAQARANLLRDRVLLDRAKAQEVRYKDLLDKKFISQDAYEQVRTNAEAAGATVAADQAAIDSATLQLGYCSIRSPVTGYAGKIMIQQGNLVKANDAAPLVTINQVVPIYVSFSVPEQNLGEIRARQGKEGLKVEASLANSDKPPVSGRITFVDNATDLTTGTIKLKAEFPNADKTLWPGQFVNVALVLREQPGAIVIPSSAVQNGPAGQYVYVVRPDMTAELRNIKVARAEGGETVVAEGVAPGETVVTEGQLRLARRVQGEPGQRRASLMNIAELFVRRPVMTVLVMAGILIFGIISYRLLPVNALPNVDFPTIQVQAQLPGANPSTMASAVATPLEKQFSTIAGIDSMTSTSTDGHGDDHAAVLARSQHRCRGAGRAVGDCRRVALAAAVDADPAPAAQGQPRRRADHEHRAVVGDAAAGDGRRVCGDPARAADLDRQRRGASRGVRLAAVRGAHPARPERAGHARHRADRRRAGDRQQQCQSADRHAAGSRQGDLGAGHRPVDERRGVCAADRRLPQRRAGAPERNRPRLRQRPEQQDRRVVQRHARHHARGAAPAGNATRSRSSMR